MNQKKQPKTAIPKQLPKKTPSKSPKTTSWGGVADWYDTYLENTKGSFQEAVIAPNLIRVVAPRKNLRLLDIGCGQGYFARKFAASGATVVGADIAPELIANAQKHAPSLTFHIAPAHKLGFAKDASFDVATIVLALQNMANMAEVFSEANRVLTRGGRLILVLNHPVFRNPKHTHWGFDQKTNTQYRRIDTYLSPTKERIAMHPGKNSGEETLSYHHSLQDIFKTLSKTGFAVTKLEEWISHRKSMPGPRQKAEDTARKEIPMFMLLELRKDA